MSDQIKPYIDAVQKNSERSRSVLYFAFLICVLVIAAVRVSWSSSSALDARRLATLEAWQLLEKGDLTDVEKETLDDYRKNFPVSEGNEVIALEEVKSRYGAILSEREQLRIIELPILGSKFDVDDLPIISGITLTLLMFILSLSLKAEVSAVAKTLEKGRAATMSNKEVMDLVRLHQIMSSPSRVTGGKGLERVRLTPVWLLLLPLFVHALVMAGNVYSWVDATYIADLVPDRTKFMISANNVLVTTLGAIFLLLLLIATCACWNAACHFNDVLSADYGDERAQPA